MKIKGRRGITLMELLIVVAIVGLLAAIAIPKYGELLEKANLGATIANLGSLRSAVGIYYGTFVEMPKSIDYRQEPQFSKVFTGELPYVKAKYPKEAMPAGNQVTLGSDSPNTMGKGWYYKPNDGSVYINSVAVDINGNIYSTY